MVVYAEAHGQDDAKALLVQGVDHLAFFFYWLWI
jgi:hypothetical protein